MQEYIFNLINADKQNLQIKFNDVIFDYVAYRRFLPENVCIEIIDKIKNQSGKKVAIIFGNCQTDKLRAFFLNNKIFSDRYFVVNIPAIYSYLNDKIIGYFQENFWSLCDLFISQRVRKDNKYSPLVATQDIPSRLPESAKIVWIPNVYFDGYFPQRKTNDRNFGENLHQSGFFPAGDKYLESFLHGGGGVSTPFLNLSNILKLKILFQGTKFWKASKNLLGN